MLIGIVSLTVSAQAATYTVTNTTDSGAGSLRAAVTSAASTTADDTVNFVIPMADPGCVAGVCTITLTSGEIAPANGAGALTISGPGAGNLIISGNNASRVFDFSTDNAAGIVTLDGITIFNGRSTFGGGVVSFRTTFVRNSTFTGNTATSGGAAGGGLNCQLACTITNSTFTNNTTVGYGGAISGGGTISNTIITGNHAGEGGGIYGGGNISNSTISNNTATYAGGIEISPGGTSFITSSTISGNTAAADGGAIYVFNTGLNLIDTTITNNTSTNGSGGAIHNRLSTIYVTNCTISNNFSKFEGGGIYDFAGITAANNFLNTIIAGNTTTTATGKDYFGGLTSVGFNIIGDGTGATINGTTTGNQVGTTAVPINAKLSPLAYHGGFGLTRALLVGSLAIDAGTTTGNVNNVVPALDQRGASRIGATDIGAFEFNNSNYAATLPNGITLLVYNSQLVPDRGTFTYSVTGGSLPPGLLLTTSGITVSVTGTPALAGTYNFTVTGTDGVNTTITNYTITITSPSAAGVLIGGRVLTYNGRGIGNVRITLNEAGGSARSAISNPFGYYGFTDVEAGQTYIVTVQSKRFSFGSPSRVISVSDDLGDLDFIALP